MFLQVTAAALLFSFSAQAAAAETTAEVVKVLGLRESAAPMREENGWEKPKKIVFMTDGPARLAWLQEALKDVTLVPVSTLKQAFAAIPDADAYVGICQVALLGSGQKLKWIHSQQAGVEECLTPKVRAGGVTVTNLQRINGPNVSEHAMALLLSLTRKIDVALDNQRYGKWDTASMRKPTDLEGKTMLVVGLGGIGTDIAKKADAFGMKVIATRNSSHEGPAFVSHVGLPNELPTMIAEADVVVNVTPLTPDTMHLFDATMFARMKPAAFFINVGRGASVVTDDLVAALQAGKIAGAGLDVVEQEPLRADHPLWSTPHVIITPHTAANSELKDERAWILIRENMRRYVAGEKMYSVVDIKRGY
jgi:phosphoglycerate dehydrogenase-like enzyme